ncbi:MAG: phasin family protein, partial [Hyphomicrobium sp.]
TQALGDQVASNMTTNIDATLDAVQALTKARTLSDVQTIQANFVQDHMARMMTQWNEWMSLSMKVGENAAATVSSMATAATRAAKR